MDRLIKNPKSDLLRKIVTDEDFKKFQEAVEKQQGHFVDSPPLRGVLMLFSFSWWSIKFVGKFLFMLQKRMNHPFCHLLILHWKLAELLFGSFYCFFVYREHFFVKKDNWSYIWKLFLFFQFHGQAVVMVFQNRKMLHSQLVLLEMLSYSTL